MTSKNPLTTHRADSDGTKTRGGGQTDMSRSSRHQNYAGRGKAPWEMSFNQHMGAVVDKRLPSNLH